MGLVVGDSWLNVVATCWHLTLVVTRLLGTTAPCAVCVPMCVCPSFAPRLCAILRPILLYIQWMKNACRQSKAATDLLGDSKRGSTQRLQVDVERGGVVERRFQQIGFGARTDGNIECRTRGLSKEVLANRTGKVAKE